MNSLRGLPRWWWIARSSGRSNLEFRNQCGELSTKLWQSNDWLPWWCLQNTGAVFKHNAQEHIDLQTPLLQGGQYPHVAALNPICTLSQPPCCSTSQMCSQVLLSLRSPLFRNITQQPSQWLPRECYQNNGNIKDSIAWNNGKRPCFEVANHTICATHIRLHRIQNCYMSSLSC